MSRSIMNRFNNKVREGFVAIMPDVSIDQGRNEELERTTLFIDSVNE